MRPALAYVIVLALVVAGEALAIQRLVEKVEILEHDVAATERSLDLADRQLRSCFGVLDMKRWPGELIPTAPRVDAGGADASDLAHRDARGIGPRAALVDDAGPSLPLSRPPTRP